MGKSLLQWQPGMVVEGIFEAFKQVVETGEPQHYEKQYVYEPFDGWFHQSVVKLNDGVATTTANITARKKAEQENLKLKEQIAQHAEDRYHALFDIIDRWYAVSFYPRSGEEIASFYRDITHRKRQEQQHYLLQLADALRPISDPKQVENTACRLLGEWLGVSSVYYCEIVEPEGIIRIDSQYLRAGGVPMPSQVLLAAYNWGATILGCGDAVVVADVHQSDLVPAELVAGMEVIGARSCLVVGGPPDQKRGVDRHLVGQRQRDA
ncbi:hypothetical protein [Spirosoma oryzicola]|uniref:hypothetical protein n=1 Tax=Spirosoma oryzicola TaxID=2898794 RepID=UPI001E4200A1|nr:hypothetical protein [Spirosoma oryzicola]UHG94954.1 hypothetical protein LQ777_30440 [Spirosoma oryzicola]